MQHIQEMWNYINLKNNKFSQQITSNKIKFNIFKLNYCFELLYRIREELFYWLKLKKLYAYIIS